MVVLLALYFFGGSVIHDFALALLIGVIAGTYSSIFIAIWARGAHSDTRDPPTDHLHRHHWIRDDRISRRRDEARRVRLPP